MRSLFQHLYDLVIHSNNQFLQGGLVLGLLTAIIAYARSLPMRGIRWIQSRFVITLDVTNDDPTFYWLAGWLAMQPYARCARSLSVTTMKDHYGNVVGRRRGLEGTPATSSSAPQIQLPEIILTPAPGNHFFFYKRRPIWLVRQRQSAQPENGNALFSIYNRESFQIRMISRKQDTALDLIEEARNLAIVDRKTRTDIHVLTGDYFRHVESCDPRPLSSVFLPNGDCEDILKDLKQFLVAKDWYIRRGIPYRRGYLLHGEPGTGKSSLIKALVGELRLNLYVINLSSYGLSDVGLSNALSSLAPHSVILLEDIDAAFVERSKTEDSSANRLSFSGLLNALDGAASREGWIVFMTSNHKDRVDPALIRPGRADYHLEFGYATPEQVAKMFEAWFPESEEAAEFALRATSSPATMAAIQKLLIENKNSASDALAAVERKAMHAVA